MLAAGIAEMCVVTGHESERLCGYLMEKYAASKIPGSVRAQSVYEREDPGNLQHMDPNIFWVKNPGYQNGSLLDSIKCGINGLKILQADAFFLTLADLPGIQKETYHRLLEALCRDKETEKRIAIANIHGERRHPQLILSDQMDRILRYEHAGKGGLRGFWQQAEKEILDVEIHDPGCMLDMDTRQDLEAFKKSTF